MHTLVALVALFCGVFTIGFAGATISNGRHRLTSRELPGGGYNVTVYASPADAGAVASVLEREGVTALRQVLRPGQVNFTGTVEAGRLGALTRTLQREAPEVLVLSRADQESTTQSILENLFAFVGAVAGLALVAGGVLIANSVGWPGPPGWAPSPSRSR